MKRIISLLLLIVLILSLGMPAMAAERCLALRLYGKHDYDQTDVKKPTCTSGGYYILTCRACGKTQKVETGGPNGHDWAVAGSKKPTCTENGVNSVYCTVCGKEDNQTVKALGHNYKVTSVIKEATCLAGGQEKVKCSRCGKTSTRDTGKADHAYGKWEISIAATDCSKGQRARYCIHCNKEQSEEYYPEGTLYRGISDKEAVKVLQTRLTECGYLNDSIDGIFGKKTEQAVKDMQTAAGVAVDGIAWPQSNKLLEEEWQKLKGVTAEAEAAGEEAAEDEAAEETLTSEYPFCTRIKAENGAEEVGYCTKHLNLVHAANAVIETSETDLMLSKILMQVREMYQTELDALYDEWIALCTQEEQAGVIGARAMFTAYLNAQELLWINQYGEFSEKALTRINDMLLNQCVEVCSMLEAVSAQ